jgi:hypothetical protein
MTGGFLRLKVTRIDSEAMKESGKGKVMGKGDEQGKGKEKDWNKG